MLDERANYWLPVDQYVGGIEHAVLHLLYARFFYKLMRDAGLVNSDEPFTRLLCQGMVLNGGVKMSKSKGNIVDPQEMIDLYGADTVRLFIMFASPPDQAVEWNDGAVAGAHRFLRRWWSFVQRMKATLAPARKRLQDPLWAHNLADTRARDLRRVTHRILERVNRDYDKIHYNTVVAGAMELFNYLEKFDAGANEHRTTALRESVVMLNKILSPIAPHISHRLWHELGEDGDVIDARWPVVDSEALKSDRVKLVIQVNGKLRSEMEVPVSSTREEIESMALQDPRVQKFIQGKNIRKMILVPGRLVNIVV